MRGRKAKPPRLWFNAGSGSWCILDHRDGRRRQIGTGLARYETEAAAQALAEYLGARHQRTAGERDPARLPVADVIAAYEETKLPKRYDAIKARLDAGEKVSADDRAIVRGHELLLIRLESLALFFGARTVAEIKGQLCRDYVDWATGTPNERNAGLPSRARTVSDQTARRHLEDLRAALNAYHAEHTLAGVPKVILPEKAESRDRWLTRGEAARLLAAAMGFRWDATRNAFARTPEGRLWRADKRVRTVRRAAARFILLTLYSGRREETARRTQWLATPTHPWLDLDRFVYHGRGAAERRTRKRRPPARIATRLRPHLTRWARLDARLADELGHDVRFVIHRGDGKPFSEKIRTAWDGILTDAGLGPDVVRHVLRHTAATWLMQAGTDPWQAAGFLGMTLEQLQATYGHHHPDFQDEAAEAFSRKSAS